MGKDDPELARVAKAIGEDKATRKVTRDGPRYSVEQRFRQALKPGDRFAYPPVGYPVFTVTRGQDDSYVLRGLSAAPDSVRSLERLVLRFRGTLTAKLPGKAVEHNGTPDGGLFSTTYRWTLGSLRDPAPYLVTKTGR